MASPDVLEFEQLLAPIPGESPVGVDPRADISPLSEYQKVKEDRKVSRQTENQIDRGGDQSPPDWRPLIENAKKLLRETSKDMEVVAYLIEGLTRVKKFAGIRDGFKLAADLIETYGTALFPDPDDTDIENRFSHLLQLNGIDSAGALVVPIAKIPFTGLTSVGEFSLTHYQTAQTIAKIADPKARAARIDQAKISMEILQKAVNETPSKFYIDLVDDLNASVEQFRRFCDVLGEKLKYDAQSDNLRTAFESYLDAVMSLAKSKLPVAPVAAAKTEESVAEAPQAAAAAPQAGIGGIHSREDALEALNKVAEYFRKTEPQSIIPFTLDQVIHWGRLSLPELLAELIPDEGPRKNLFKQVGIKPP